jgi:hypothetical protein
MTEIKDLVPGLNENKIRLEVVYIRSELQTTQQELFLHVVQSTLDSQISMPFCLQEEHSTSKICNASALSSQRGIQRPDPRLVAVVHALAQPTMAPLAASSGKTTRVKDIRYSHLPRQRILASDCRLQHVFNVSNLLTRIGSVYHI